MSSERRRFFRIDDSIGVAYRLLSDEELADQLGDDIKPVDSLNLIASYDSKISNLCGQLHTRDPANSGAHGDSKFQVKCSD